MFAAVLLAGAALVPQLPFAGAQTSNATCTPDFNWAENSLGQSPCIMASYLRAACDGNHQINSLPEGYHYNGPSDPQYSEPCWCSSVTYSLYAACQVCQGRVDSLFTWGQWSTNCTATDVADGFFPKQLPTGTAIPAWAYERTYDKSESFSAVEAQNFAATNKTEYTRQTMLPSSSGLGNPLPSASGGNNGNGGNGNNNGGNNNNNNNNGGGNSESGSKSNAGAIAGGVVGGVAGLAIIGAIIFFFMRKKKQSAAGSPLIGQEAHPQMGQMGGYEQSPFTPPPPGSGSPGFSGTDTSSQRFYDPSDPSTFPVANTSPPPHGASPLSYNSGPTQQIPQPNRYSAHPNVAEL